MLALAGAAQAADYPERPVRVIVTFPAGGGTDIVARMIFQKVAERAGGSFVIDNRGGAGGTIGTELAARAPADGYTIVVVSGSHTINPALYKKLAYDAARDFAPISMLVSGPGVLVVHPSLPARSVKELIAVAKSRPGELLYASPGNGTPPHLAAELFKSMAGVNIVHVPVQRQCAGDDGSHSGPGVVIVSDRPLGHAARAGEAFARAGRYDRQTCGGTARYSDDRRIRPAGLRRERMVRCARARRHAARDHCETAE